MTEQAAYSDSSNPTIHHTNTPHANPHQADTDRYVSFCGIDCDGNAAELMETLDAHIQAEKGDIRWREYFIGKREEQAKRGQDNLFFVGSQVNSLYAYLETCEDEDALDLLWRLEQECC